MRILLVDLSARFGGTSSRCLNLLSTAPSDTWALAGLEESPVVKEAERRGIEYYTVGRSKYDPAIFFRLTKLLKENQFQLVDVQNPQAKFWAIPAAVRMKIPLVSTLNSWYVNEHGGSMKGKWYQFFELKTAVFTAAYITVSQEIERELLAHGIPAEKVNYVPNSVRINADEVEANREWLAEQFDIDVSGTVCCAVGRLVEAKGFAYLIEAIAELKAEGVCCLIVGDGEKKAELQQLIRETGLEQNVKITGLQDQEEVYRIMKSSDIFVLSSLSEGMPISVLEAAALEKPIVTTEVGQIPEVFAHEKHALLIEKADSSMIASGIARLMENPEFAASMGFQARVLVNETYALKEQFQTLETVYKKNVSEGK